VQGQIASAFFSIQRIGELIMQFAQFLSQNPNFAPEVILAIILNRDRIAQPISPWYL
jgi:hypothetical protein